MFKSTRCMHSLSCRQRNNSRTRIISYRYKKNLGLKGAVWFALLRPPNVSSKTCITVQWFLDYLWILKSDSEWKFQKLSAPKPFLLSISEYLAIHTELKLSFTVFLMLFLKNCSGMLNIQKMYVRSKPVGQNHFKESIGSPKITVR